jgi:hypothetical protein
MLESEQEKQKGRVMERKIIRKAETWVDREMERRRDGKTQRHRGGET